MSAIDDQPHITSLLTWHQVGSQVKYAATKVDEPPLRLLVFVTHNGHLNFIVKKMNRINIRGIDCFFPYCLILGISGEGVVGK